MKTYRTYRWNELSNAQVKAARRFSDQLNLSVSQAAKYLSYCFACERGEITREEFHKATGHKWVSPEQRAERDAAMRRADELTDGGRNEPGA